MTTNPDDVPGTPPALTEEEQAVLDDAAIGDVPNQFDGAGVTGDDDDVER